VLKKGDTFLGLSIGIAVKELVDSQVYSGMQI